MPPNSATRPKRSRRRVACLAVVAAAVLVGWALRSDPFAIHASFTITSHHSAASLAWGDDSLIVQWREAVSLEPSESTPPAGDDSPNDGNHWFDAGPPIRMVTRAMRLRYADGTLTDLAPDQAFVWPVLGGTGRDRLPSDWGHVGDPLHLVALPGDPGRLTLTQDPADVGDAGAPGETVWTQPLASTRAVELLRPAVDPQTGRHRFVVSYYRDLRVDWPRYGTLHRDQQRVLVIDAVPNGDGWRVRSADRLVGRDRKLLGYDGVNRTDRYPILSPDGRWLLLAPASAYRLYQSPDPDWPREFRYDLIDLDRLFD